MDFSELKNKNEAELKEILKEKQEELRALRFGAGSGQLKQVHKFKDIKRMVARIQSILPNGDK